MLGALTARAGGGRVKVGGVVRGQCPDCHRSYRRRESLTGSIGTGLRSRKIRPRRCPFYLAAGRSLETQPHGVCRMEVTKAKMEVFSFCFGPC